MPDVQSMMLFPCPGSEADVAMDYSDILHEIVRKAILAGNNKLRIGELKRQIDETFGGDLLELRGRIAESLNGGGGLRQKEGWVV